MIAGLCLKLIDKANSQKIRSFLEKVISSVVAPAGDDVGDIGVIDISDDQQSDKWKQKRGAVVVGVGSLS